MLYQTNVSAAWAPVGRSSSLLRKCPTGRAAAPQSCRIPASCCRRHILWGEEGVETRVLPTYACDNAQCYELRFVRGRNSDRRSGVSAFSQELCITLLGHVDQWNLGGRRPLLHAIKFNACYPSEWLAILTGLTVTSSPYSSVCCTLAVSLIGSPCTPTLVANQVCKP